MYVRTFGICESNGFPCERRVIVCVRLHDGTYGNSQMFSAWRTGFRRAYNRTTSAVNAICIGMKALHKDMHAYYCSSILEDMRRHEI